MNIEIKYIVRTPDLFRTPSSLIEVRYIAIRNVDNHGEYNLKNIVAKAIDEDPANIFIRECSYEDPEGLPF